jgi:peptidoglycan hydrolase-like amidase
VRIGVVLPQDDRVCVHLQIGDDAYELCDSDTMSAPRGLRGCAVRFEIVGAGISVRDEHGEIASAREWRLSPASAGVESARPCLWVHGVPAGRGFHWERDISIRQPGLIEVTRRNNKLFVVAVVPVEDYMLGVITSEMGAACPPEFLKAQCVVARSWGIAHTEHKHDDLDFDYCNDDCCQRFHGFAEVSPEARHAVESTAGQVLLAEGGVVVDANYSKSCGGVVEDPQLVFGMAKPGLAVLADAPADSPLQRMIPVDESRLSEFLEGDWLSRCDAYCSPRVVPNETLTRFLGPVDTGEGFFRWRVTYTREELEDVLRTKLFQRLCIPAEEGLNELCEINVLRRGWSGRALEIELVYFDAQRRQRRLALEDQYWIRHALHKSFLYSSAFRVDTRYLPDGRVEGITLVGAGWGHGVGLCQIGGLGMALSGFTYDAILRHYFPLADLKRVYG